MVDKRSENVQQGVGKDLNASSLPYAELRDTFKLFDLCQTGYIDPQDVRSCLLNLNVDLETPVVFEMVKTLERYIRDKKRLSFNDFVQVVGSSTYKDPATALEHPARLFHLFDPHRTGMVTPASLKKVCDDIGEPISNEEVEDMIRRADADKDGCVNLDDFCRIMSQKPL